MASQKPLVTTPAVSVAATIRHFVERKGLSLTAYFEFAGRVPCTIDGKWEIHGVTVNEKELSFVASLGDQKPVKFSVWSFASINQAREWLEDLAKNIKNRKKVLLTTEIPKKFVFFAGTTEFVPMLRQKTA